MVKFMRMSALCLFALCRVSAAWGGSGTSAASFLKLEPSARTAALGGAFAPLANDPAALFSNPSGLALLNKREAAFTHHSWFAGMNNETLVYVHPLDEEWGIGFGAGMFLGGSLDKYDINGNKTGSYNAGGSFFTAGAGHSFNKQFSVGASVKLVREYLASRSGSAFAVDGGMLYKDEKWRLGAALQNLGTAMKVYEQSSALPRLYRAGAAARVARSVWLSGEVAKYNDSPAVLHLGAEVSVRITDSEALLPRIGFRTGASSNAGSGLNLGLGLRLRRFEFDYCFSPLGDLGSSHLITLSYKLDDFSILRDLKSGRSR